MTQTSKHTVKSVEKHRTDIYEFVKFVVMYGERYVRYFKSLQVQDTIYEAFIYIYEDKGKSYGMSYVSDKDGRCPIEKVGLNQLQSREYNITSLPVPFFERSVLQEHEIELFRRDADQLIERAKGSTIIY